MFLINDINNHVNLWKWNLIRNQGKLWLSPANWFDHEHIHAIRVIEKNTSYSFNKWLSIRTRRKIITHAINDLIIEKNKTGSNTSLLIVEQVVSLREKVHSEHLSWQDDNHLYMWMFACHSTCNYAIGIGILTHTYKKR